MFLLWSSILAFSLATIGLALILHPQFSGLEFISNICTLGLAMVGLAFLLLGSLAHQAGAEKFKSNPEHISFFIESQQPL